MKKDNLKDLSLEDLQKQIKELSKEYQKLRLAHKISAIENPIQVRNLRRQIARVHTQIAAKQQ